MGRLFFWLVLLGAAMYLYTSGLAMALSNGNIPQLGRECHLAGPKNGHIFLCSKKENAVLPLDACIGFSQRDRHVSEVQLVRELENGGIICPPDSTKVKVLNDSEIPLYGCPYHVVQVQLMDGQFKGKKGWVIREDVMDTPLEIAINQFRSGSKHLEHELENCDPDERDPMEIAVPKFRRPRMEDDR